MTQPALKVEGLWKEYSVGKEAPRHETFYDVITESIKAPLRRLREIRRGESPHGGADQFWALRDLNFEIAQGEVVGVIGRNGAGKSTLLKILSRITAPTRGRIEARGRMASLLEVGTGFHPELSGRENIYLNGAILGMSRREVARKFDEIVEFAEINRFLDTPVKRYSSGMYVRLAFSVAAHLESDIRLVDEVLAVGDAAFQEKCISAMGDISKGGRTVIFVSHNHGAVARLCTRGLVLSGGELRFDGATGDALAAYAVEGQLSQGIDGMTLNGGLQERVRLNVIRVNGSTQQVGNAYRPEEEIQIALLGEAPVMIQEFRVTFAIVKGGTLVVGLHDLEVATDLAPGNFESSVSIPPYFLSPGDYDLEVCAYSARTGEWMWLKNAGRFSVVTDSAPLYEPSERMGLVNLRQAGERREWV